MNEIVEARGRRHKVFSLGGDRYRLETGNHYHCLKGGLWLPVDTAVDSGSGVDGDTGMQYIAQSRSGFLDYDIRFGKNDPVWMKIKHIPTNKTVVFKPRHNNNNPDHVISGNKIYVSQAWDGIDMEIFVNDFGTKTNYIITSPAGQRIIEFNVNGDLGSFVMGNAWYEVDGETVIVPRSFASGVLSFDMRQVPVGTKVDPTVQIAEDKNLAAFTLVKTGSPWTDVVNATDATSCTEATTGAVRVARIIGPDGSYSISRGYFNFDTSALDDGVTVTGALLYVTPSTLSPAAESIIVQKSTTANTDPTTASWDELAAGVVGTAVSIASAAVDTELSLSVPAAAVSLTGETKVMTRNYEHDYLDSAPSSETQRFYAYGPQDGTAAYRPRMSVDYSSSKPPRAYQFSKNTSNPFRWR